MKLPGFIFGLLFFTAGLAGQSTGNAALIVALSNYSPLSNWPATHAGNDVPVVVNALLEHGFKKEDIQVLLDDEATKAGIENAIRNGLLVQATEGGTVVLHFSGHGQQVQDDKGDGLDNALVPFDSPKDFKPGEYQGENLLRDEQLARMLEPVRQKLGPSGHLLLVVDASYNGAGSRGQTGGRGADVIMADPAFLNRLREHPDATEPYPLQPVPPETAPGLAPMTTLLASSTAVAAAETLADDGTPVGALSYAFAKALAGASPGNTYADLMADIRRIMCARAPLQTPGLEGDAGSLIPVDRTRALRSFAVSALDKQQQQQVQLEAGLLQGLLPGSEMVFFPAGPVDTIGLAPLAAGKVIDASLLSATVQLSGKIQPLQLKYSRAFFRQRNFGGLLVRVCLNLPETPLARQIRAQCQTLPYLRFEPENADLYIRNAPNGAIEMQTRDGILLYSDSSAVPAAGPFIEQIRRFAQAQYFRELKLDEASLQSALDLIPVKATRTGGKIAEQARFPLSARTDDFGNIRLGQGEKFKVALSNGGTRPAYYSLLYILPDNSLITLIPPPGKSETWRLEAGESRECSAFFQVPPLEGKGVLKLIASENPLDLSAVVENKGQMLRGENARDWNAVEQFFAKTFQNAVNLPEIPSGTANISTFIFNAGAPSVPKY